MSGSSLRFDGRVVLVTGAGGGLGKVYAHFFAARGASVVVNDLGAPRMGENGQKIPAPADEVVKEIVSSGGKAVANYDNVENGEKIVETAMKAFGRVDIVINNAGILRDKSISRMTDQDWDLVHAVHVRGSYKVTRAAWPIMQKQKYGKIIMTSSAAGIYGNYGQTNYSSAKLALYALSCTLAKEGEKHHIHCNAIAPIAASKMTETVLPPEILQALNPEFVAPLVGFLTHESVSETGSLFEVGAGFIAKLRRERSHGVLFKPDQTFTPGSVASKWDEICDFSNQVTHPTSNDTNWVGLLEASKSLPPNPKPEPLRFDGRVVLVTGAGSGLGRAYAHLFAKLGASVVVNDLGGGLAGSGHSNSRAADVVVQEIKAFGGQAVANYDSVEQGEKLVETAIKNFGKIDIIVNNAGILRDKSFSKMTDQDWDFVYSVHLRGSFKVVKAAWPYMMKNKYGRIINTTSAVGLYGNFGQANYGAAKSALIGFSNSLALEGKKYNIFSNAIAPLAGTRMTATVMPPEMVEMFKPEYVAPLVGYLCHESTKSTGGVFEVGACWVSAIRWQKTGGYGFPHNKELTPEQVASKWDVITNFDDGRATYPTSTQEAFQQLYANATNISEAKTESRISPKSKSSSQVDVNRALSLQFDVSKFKYTERDVILYGLGLNCSRNDLDIVYENHENFHVLPTYGVIMSFNSLNSVSFGDIFPNFNPMMLLHGEQYLELKKPLPTSGEVFCTPKILDICDKGKGAAVTTAITTTDASGNQLCYNESTVFIRGVGGFGGYKDRKNVASQASVSPNNIPNRPPDAVITEKTSENQALIYRLSGDLNPLHIDPQMSAIGGFKVPILHGLCSFGIAGKHIFRTYCDSNPNYFKSMKARFSKHVFPGETLQTEMWKEDNKVIFRVRVLERDVIAISNAAVELNYPEKLAKL